MFRTFAVTYALIKISVEAGHPGFGIYFPNQIKRSAIKQAKESNLGWGKWQIAMFIISTARLLAKKGKLIDKKHGDTKIGMRAAIAFDKIYEVALKKLTERNLDHDCVVDTHVADRHVRTPQSPGFRQDTNHSQESQMATQRSRFSA